jgi:transglutaminase-like putative cysteine protease
MLAPHNLYRASLVAAVAAVGLVCGVTPALAKDFRADYAVTYSLQPESGQMHVRQQVTLTNQAPNLRASSYSLTLESGGYKNLVAKDSRGNLPFKESKNSDGLPVITFTFNDRVVGVGSQLKWTLDYDSPTLAHKNGQVWDVAIPRVKEHPSYDIGTYTANLSIPKSAGKEAFVSPAPDKRGENGDALTYTFSKDHVLPAGIIAAFGDAQVFKFNLKYHLQNPNIGQASTEIALPPDMAPYQQVIYDRLDPAPVSLRTDRDGNTMATYYLKSRQSLDVTFTGWSRNPSYNPKLDSPKKISDIPQSLTSAFTSEQKYWETSDPALIKKAKELVDPSKPAVDNARAIYAYVTTTMHYNTARINKDLKRLGASEAFKNPDNAVCMEFTDVFVTLARIAGIPAREVDGYAYTADSSNQPIFYPGLGSDILHAWAQIYLPDAGWVNVDPTWGSTTGGVDFFGRSDLNRVGFAIKGYSSQTPYAAGSYKTNDKQDGDVKVEFSTVTKTGEPKISTTLGSNLVISGFGSSLPLKISNTGTVAAYHVSPSYTLASPLKLKSDKSSKTDILLPGQTTTVTLPVTTSGWLDRSTSIIDVKVAAMRFDQKDAGIAAQLQVRTTPIFLGPAVPYIGLFFLVAGSLWGAWYGLHHMYRRQSRDTRLSNESPDAVQRLAKD